MDRLDLTLRGQPGTKWRGVSSTSGVRREDLSQDTVTGPAGHGAHQPFVGGLAPTCQCVLRSLRSGGNLFSVVGVNHS